MITPAEIQAQCSNWWKEVLIYRLDALEYFPKSINRIGQVTSKDILNKLSAYKESIEILKKGSKSENRLGYTLVLTDREFDKIGKQQVPQNIVIETIDDYLKVIGKEKDFKKFLNAYSLIQQELPILHSWLKINPLKLIEHDTWSDTLMVCKYFLSNPKPDLYLRQLPIDVHTKYIRNNKSIIQSLLEFLIPEHVNAHETKFELRFNLKYSEPLIRVRFLDRWISPIDNISDISFTISEFKTFNSGCKNVFVTENIMNFLTLPSLTNTLAIWSGGGFNVSYLKDVDWLKSKQFYYWGDIDSHGFQILNQFRTYFPNTVSIMMDKETLAQFKSGEGEKAANQHLQFLSESELNLYKHVRDNNIRLEQEKITQIFAERKILQLMVGD